MSYLTIDGLDLEISDGVGLYVKTYLNGEQSYVAYPLESIDLDKDEEQLRLVKMSVLMAFARYEKNLFHADKVEMGVDL